MEIQQMIFYALGGLGIFLFGIRYMSEGIQNAAGDRLRVFLEAGTKTPLRGVLTGALVTALIQSSSGTTVLTVGLVNAGLLNLRQAIGIIMGANIGTTMTAYLIGFKLEEFALPLIAFGVIILFFVKNKRIANLGQIIFGFGMLFYGMDIMGEGLKPLKDLPIFIDLMLKVEDHALLGVFVGTVFTMIVQSSSATIGVLQELADQGAITYLQSIPILFGDNIGTTITALLASIGTTVAAKRAAMSHALFNIVGTAIFLPLFVLGIFPELVRLVTDYILVLLPGMVSFEALNIKMQIAQTHGIFNITNTLIQLPFVAYLAIFVSRCIPDKTTSISKETNFLEPRLLSNPSMALGQVSQEILHMGNVVKKFLKSSLQLFYHPTIKEQDLINLNHMERTVDTIERDINSYLVKISSSQKISEEQSNYVSSLSQIAHDLERIGDHSDNIVELAVYEKENNIKFTDEAIASIEQMSLLTEETFNLSLLAFEKNDKQLAKKVLKNEIVIDNLEKEFRYGHIRRMNEGRCSGFEGSVFLDILGNMERIGDHCVNIAEYVIHVIESKEKNKPFENS